MIPRVIVIGDVHGCLDELVELIYKVGYNSTKDKLVFVGDLVDRGPEPVKVIQFVRGLGASCVLGNHDERYIRYRRHLARKDLDPSYVIPMKAPTGDISLMTEDDYRWLERLPTAIRISDHWAVVHAGLEPGIPLDFQSADALLHARYIRKSNKKYERNLSTIVAGDVQFWTELWDGQENIIYGHMITPMKTPHIDISVGGALCVGIDTGCCFGHALTAMILEPNGRSFSFASVQAKKAYDAGLAGYAAATSVH